MHLSDFIDVQSNLNNKVCIDDNNDSYRKFLPKRDYVLFNIAKNNQTYDIALEAIKNDGMELRFLSKKLLLLISDIFLVQIGQLNSGFSILFDVK